MANRKPVWLLGGSILGGCLFQGQFVGQAYWKTTAMEFRRQSVADETSLLIWALYIITHQSISQTCHGHANQLPLVSGFLACRAALGSSSITMLEFFL